MRLLAASDVHGFHEVYRRAGRHFNVASGGMYRAMVIDTENLTGTVERGPLDAS